MRCARAWFSNGKPQGRTKHLVISFHGIPENLFHNGDPYFYKCRQTARLLADELMLRDDEWSVSFHSKFGPGAWLRPYTIDVMAGLPARGIDEVSVVCPGFAVDCLETVEEIDMENRAAFLARGRAALRVRAGAQRARRAQPLPRGSHRPALRRLDRWRTRAGTGRRDARHCIVQFRLEQNSRSARTFSRNQYRDRRYSRVG